MHEECVCVYVENVGKGACMKSVFVCEGSVWGGRRECE